MWLMAREIVTKSELEIIVERFNPRDMAGEFYRARLHLPRRHRAGQQHPALIDGCSDALVQPGIGSGEGRLEIGFDLQIGNGTIDTAFLSRGIATAGGTRERPH